MKMKKILVTGGSGFLGGHIIKKGHLKYQIDATYLSNAYSNDKAIYHSLDLTEENNLLDFLEFIRPDVIIHTAAIAKPDLCEENKEYTKKINIDTTGNIAVWSKKNNVRLIFTSTDMVFDGKGTNYSESDKPNPISFYGDAKYRSEKILAELNLNAVIVRVALIYGIGLFSHNCFFENMINNIKIDQTITLFYDQYRTPILVDNLAEAILELCENNFKGIIHLGGKERISRFDFGIEACNMYGLSSENILKKSMFDTPQAASRPQDVSLNTNLAQKILKTKLLNCKEGLQEIKENI